MGRREVRLYSSSGLGALFVPTKLIIPLPQKNRTQRVPGGVGDEAGGEAPRGGGQEAGRGRQGPQAPYEMIFFFFFK